MWVWKEGWEGAFLLPWAFSDTYRQALTSLQSLHASAGHKLCCTPAPSVFLRIGFLFVANPSPGQCKLTHICVCCTYRTPSEYVCMYSVVGVFFSCFLFETKIWIILPPGDAGVFTPWECSCWHPLSTYFSSKNFSVMPAELPQKWPRTILLAFLLSTEELGSTRHCFPLWRAQKPAGNCKGWCY